MKTLAIMGMLGSLAIGATIIFIEMIMPYSVLLTGWLAYAVLLGFMASVASFFERGPVLRGNAVAMILTGLSGMLLWFVLLGWAGGRGLRSLPEWLAQITGWSGPVLLMIAGVGTYRKGRAARLQNASGTAEQPRIKKEGS